MIFNQNKEYPACGGFIRNYIDALNIWKPDVYQAFIEFCESEELASKALRVGHFPEIRIVAFMKNGYEQTNVAGHYKGIDDPTLKNVVFISKHLAQGYEDDRSNWKNLERTILHEMVHWARHVGGKSYRTADDREAGLAFEEKAYNSFVSDHY